MNHWYELLLSFLTGLVTAGVFNDGIKKSFTKLTTYFVQDMFDESRKARKERHKLADDITKFVSEDPFPEKMDYSAFLALQARAPRKHRSLIFWMDHFKEMRHVEHFFLYLPLIKSNKNPIGDPVIMEAIKVVSRETDFMRSAVLMEVDRLKGRYPIYQPILSFFGWFRYHLYSKYKIRRKFDAQKPVNVMLKELYEYLDIDIRKLYEEKIISDFPK